MLRSSVQLLTTFILSLSFKAALAQESKIVVPTSNDKYSEYVKKLESGNTDIDYTDFRNSFLQSSAYSKKSIAFSGLQKEVRDAVEKSDYKKVISTTQQMLSLDYTSMFAHMYLQKTYKILGDTVNSKKYHDIEFGLINSIVKSGDGLTCATGWHVTQIEEEYFILRVVLGGEVKGQAISNGGKNACDKMTIKTEEGDEKVFYFEANKVFEMESKLFGN